MKHLLAELIGTFFLMFAVALTGNPLCYGFVFAAVLYLTAHVSGGYCNPALTLALFLRGKYKRQHALHLFAGQLIGAGAALALACQMTNRPLNLSADPMALSMPCLSEFLLTFFLSAVVISLAAQKLKEVGHLVAGLTLLGVGYMGGICNPVLSLATQLFAVVKMGGFDAHSFLVFFVCPLVGALVSAYAFNHYAE